MLFEKKVLRRFRSRVEMVMDTYSCWEWKGATSPYGSFYFRGKKMGAHRVSYILFKEEIPDGHVILHACDNPSCVRPSHLSAGTLRDNVIDMYIKGRAKGGTKLTIEDVENIRSVFDKGYLTISSLAWSYNVSMSTIRNIVNFRTWNFI